MDLESAKQFQNKLLEWYDCSARVLPWRNNPSPYRVWISEIMLQQTRVDTVKPYFERFMSSVPNIQKLANIPENELLKLWEGLGYYSRARNLKKAAIVIIQKFGGQIPSDIDSLQSLPGIGPYSSGAIASIAFGRRATAIDGNVLRVMARITANKGDITNKDIKKEIEALVQEVLPIDRIGDFNQGLMELGARICLPSRNPKCMECPVHPLCFGFLEGIAAELPVKSKKKERKIELKTIFVINYKGKVAIRQRTNKGLLASLWEFPNVEGHLSNEECERKLREWGITSYEISPMNTYKHIFTHLEWHMIGYSINVQSIKADDSFTWVTREKIKEEYAIPTALKTYREDLETNYP